MTRSPKTFYRQFEEYALLLLWHFGGSGSQVESARNLAIGHQLGQA